MTKNAIAWIREDFRIEHNPALSYATQNHENVIALYIYNKADFDRLHLVIDCYMNPKLKDLLKQFDEYNRDTANDPFKGTDIEGKD